LSFGLLTTLFTSYHQEQILHQLSEAIILAINSTHPQQHFILHVLHDLTKLEDHPWCLMEMEYK